MSPERWRKVLALFDAAVELPAEARPVFVAEHCAGDAALQYEVRHLLLMNEQTGTAPDRTSPQPEHMPQEGAATLLFVPGDVIAERFHIVRFLGRGGMGEVYEATDHLLHDSVALKVMQPGPGDPSALAEQLRREVRLARKVTHPGVCRVHDVALHHSPQGDVIVLTMELIRGETLASRLRRGPLEVAPALDLARQIGGALDAAHAEQILHRDIKPGNILLEPHHGGERAVLSDFGVARAFRPDASTHLRVGTIVGTPRYMAPEQFRGAEPSVRSDIYSFGVVLHEMVTGVPYPGDPFEVTRPWPVQPSRQPTEGAPILNPVWAGVISRALDPDPAMRFASCREMLAALSPAAGGAGRWRPRLGTRLSAIGLVATVIGIATLVSPRLRSAPLTDKDTIVLADFANTTGDPVFDDTLKLGLSVQLRQSPFLNILPDQTVAETLTLMGRAPSDTVTADLAHDVCIRTKSKAVLTGTIAKLGSQYILGLRAQDCLLRADLAQEQVEAGRKEDVLKALDKAAGSVRKALGESRGTLDKFDAPLAQVTTPSLEALRAYSLGEKAFLEAGDAAALVFFNRAVELDPQFAMAYVSLGAHYVNLSQSRSAIESFEKAYALRDRASERERYRITAEYFVFVTGELERANLVFEQWARAYPRDYKAFGRLARNQLSLGQLEASVAPSLEALRLFPGAISHSVNLIYIYLALNRPLDARAIYERAIAQQPDHQRLHLTRYAMAFYDGDVAEMHRQARWVAGRHGDEDKQLSFQADTEAYFGRLRQARSLTRQAAAIAERSGLKETAAIYWLNAALNEAEVGRLSEARQLVRTALGSASSDNVHILAALALSRCGDADGATALVDELNRTLPNSTPLQNFWLPAIRASMARSRSEAAAAIDVLTPVLRYELGVPEPDSHVSGTLYPVYVRGDAYLKAGRAREAAAEFQKLIDHRGVALNFVLGALAHLQLGRAKAQSGDLVGARQAYDRFLGLWKEADPDVPVLKAARTEYARLQ